MPKNAWGRKNKIYRTFIKSGLIPFKASDIASLLFDNRQNADYDFDAEITTEAGNLIKQARTFLELTTEYLSDLSGSNI